MAAEQEILVKNIGWLENTAERTAIPSSREGLHASFPQVNSQLVVQTQPGEFTVSATVVIPDV
ncbi:MAG: hypothetical protein CMJ77_08950 [Planctomycetaceae bacterium]|nr:hypothetical protein [Planctomycetaceae bacterium]